MDVFAQLAESIIKEQETIIGPVAFEQALRVPGLKVDQKTHKVTLDGNNKEILEKLVKQYEQLFGRTSIEVCKEAVRETKVNISKDDLPDILK
ncbi:hypothetical protein HZA75_07155 [Candidatus Roizmanbacteria bacterium]|nr:hypothetical protein [Candidatus Roizmanbacteria bacterium]